MTRVVCYEVWDGPFFAGRRKDWFEAVAYGARLAAEESSGISVTETVELFPDLAPPGTLPARIRREIVAWSPLPTLPPCDRPCMAQRFGHQPGHAPIARCTRPPYHPPPHENPHVSMDGTTTWT